ncbi:trypsin-like peptidase domain-containing protein [Mucisphaera sp.]|uniref:trypsin-like peptidase domain-containing protein n=1 Tax=Mucisphaera sp. TaxID=2913024 RepID=UPI003D0AC21E
MGQLRWYGPSLVLIVAALSVMLLGPTAARQIVHAHEAERIVLARENLVGSSVLTELSEAFTNVSQVVEPSVVKVAVFARADVRRRMQGQQPNLREWFFGPESERQNPNRNNEDDNSRFNERVQIGSGSGWVYDDQGHVITNNHVIENAEQVRLEFANGEMVDAEIIGTDPRTDIAVLKVDSDYLHPAAINTGELRQGEIVFAFGSPLGFDFSMSQGIVSATGRQLGILRDRRGGFNSGYEDFIQTDAAINRGNSGGPLTNVYGEVVGMNTAIASRSGGSNGLGFAIPSEMIVEVVDQLLETGRVSRGYLGVMIRDVDDRMARAYGLDSTDGVFVQRPVPGSPADEAGLRAEDIILEINGRPVETADQLRFRIARMGPGTEVEVTVWRVDRTRRLTITLGELPDSPQLANRRMPDPETPNMPASIELLERVGIEGLDIFQGVNPEETIEGLTIEEVRPGSAAAVEGIQPGFIITEMQGQPVSDMDSLDQALQDLNPGDIIRLRVVTPRNLDEPIFVFLEIPEDE